MHFDKFLNLLATIFGAFGGIYVMRSIMAMSPELMLEQAKSKWGFSVPKIEALASQKAENIAGFVFVVVAFVLAIATIAFVPEGVRAFESKWLALALAAMLAGGVFITLHFVSQRIYRHQKRAIGKIVTLEYLDTLSSRAYIVDSDHKALSLYANLLGLKGVPDEPTRSLTERIFAEVGKTLPPNLDYSAVEPNQSG